MEACLGMIISLRGTNGAGKSTIVRTLMKDYPERHEIRMIGRRKPIGYRLSHPGLKDVFVPGHYEIANGGIDTLRDLEEAYDMIEEYDKIGCHVIYEGKNTSDGTARIRRFTKEQVIVVVITHPVEACIASVRARGHSIREETIHRVSRKVLNDAGELAHEGFSVFRLNRQDALEKCRTELRKGVQRHDRRDHHERTNKTDGTECVAYRGSSHEVI